MAEIYSTTPPYQEPPRNRNTTVVVTVIILLLLLCCCCGLLAVLWFTGDQILDWFNLNIQMFQLGLRSL